MGQDGGREFRCQVQVSAVAPEPRGLTQRVGNPQVGVEMSLSVENAPGALIVASPASGRQRQGEFASRQVVLGPVQDVVESGAIVRDQREK